MKTFLTLALSSCVILHSSFAAPRNVVLFIADDMGQDAGCYGNMEVKTPALDQLAREGTRYRYAFCTSSSCSASRSVILSGLQNHATGHYGHAHSEHHFSTYGSVQSLPVILFGSDNGKPWPGAKTTLYEPGMRLPLVVRSPDQTRRGVVSDAMISWVDFTPTILDIAGVKDVMAPALQKGDPEGGPGTQAPPKKKPLVKYQFHGRSFLPKTPRGRLRPPPALRTLRSAERPRGTGEPRRQAEVQESLR